VCRKRHQVHAPNTGDDVLRRPLTQIEGFQARRDALEPQVGSTAYWATGGDDGGVPYDDTHLRDRGPGVSRAAKHWVEQTRRDLELVRRNPRGTKLEAMDNFGSDRTLHRRVKKWAEAEERTRAGPAGPRQQRQHTRGVTVASGTRPELENESNSWWEGDAAVAAAAAAEAAAANS
jgi:hypothetical protein